jgi:hypothetical protein
MSDNQSGAGRKNDLPSAQPLPASPAPTERAKTDVRPSKPAVVDNKADKAAAATPDVAENGSD